MSNGTVKATSEQLGISKQQIYGRFNDCNFAKQYKFAKSEIVRETVRKINLNISKAIETIFEIMTEKENNAAIRLQASQTILKNALAFSNHLKNSEEIYLKPDAFFGRF